MSSPGSPTLELDVAARRTEKRVAWFAIVAAAAAPCLIGASWQIVLLSIVAAAACRQGFQHAGWLGGAQSLRHITWRPEGHWLLKDVQGREFEATLRADSRLLARLVWLRWNAADQVRDGRTPGIVRGGTRSMLLSLGDIPEPQLRRLRVRLRLAP